MTKEPAYIGRQIPHFEKVDVSKISPEFSVDMLYRYKLSLPFHPEPSRTKRAAIILKNPSSADAIKADKTVYNAAKTIYLTYPDVGTVEILNLFGIRGTKPIDVMTIHDNGGDIVGDRNDDAIAEVLSKSDYVILAWGGASPIKKSIYDQRIAEVYFLLGKHSGNMKMFRKAERGSDRYPFHACYWPHNENFIEACCMPVI